MTRFIPLSVFRELYSEESRLLSDDGLQLFIEKLRGPEGKAIADREGINVLDLGVFADSFRDPQLVVFHGWVEQNKVLFDFLLSGKLEGAFIDVKKHLGHLWAPGYKRFLSPFLSSRLLSASHTSMEELSFLFSFVVLLDDDHRAVVEDQLFKDIDNQLKQLSAAGVVEDEQELANLIQPLCSDEIITSVNYLSKASYALKMRYVDTILTAIRSNGCTVRLANWILKQMSRVHLNNEHNYKLNDLRQDLREGNLKVRNQGKGKTPVPWKYFLVVFFVLLLAGSVVYLIVYKPFSAPDEGPDLQSGTAFKKFTKQERMELDSLIRLMDQEYYGTLEPQEIHEIDSVQTF